MRKFWRGRKVLLTGHTGFKGAWLAYWLSDMGANVSGIALAPQTEPNLYTILELYNRGSFVTGDINNREVLKNLLSSEKPEIVIHMAAQAIVRKSYEAPIETFSTNVLGTVSLLDAIRRFPSVHVVLIVTSDKVYENKEEILGYHELDKLGGHDPYSASKSCTELATQAMRRSFYGKDKHPARIATVRAGNVIGGGDWSNDRLVPDIVRGCLGRESVVKLRNPEALRPWQHVLDPLLGYLKLAALLYNNEDGYEGAWNFGPKEGETHSVREVATSLVKALGKGKIEISNSINTPHETSTLVLNSSKANNLLGWHPVFNFQTAIAITAQWYRASAEGDNMDDITLSQIKLIEENVKDKLVDLGDGK